MKKWLGIFCLCLLVQSAGATELPDNIYFRAMQAEMNRTKKHLHVEGSAKPLYIVYRIAHQEGQHFSADMGQLYKTSGRDPISGVGMAVYMYAGDQKHNSSGFVDDHYPYTVLSGRGGDSEEALRQNLWQLTDLEYIKASNLAEKKEAYRRRKNLGEEPNDFSTAPHASYVQDIQPFVPYPAAPFEALVQELSAEGKKWPYLEQYEVSVQLGQVARYFLDSEGNFYQIQVPANEVTLVASFRNTDGYKRSLQANYPLPLDISKAEEFIRAKATEFLQQVSQQRTAKKAEPYIGPVLFMPEAAAGFFQQLFIKNIRNSKPLLSARSETDASAGLFKDKVGMRVMSPVFEVFDRPQAREYQGFALAGFMPVDAEGVQAQELHLVENGKLKTLPTIRSLIKDQSRSNGHARSASAYPRANVTNVFFEPTSAVSPELLEEKLLQRCRELGLEYGYIFHSFPYVLAERIYTADGHKEAVYGIKLDGLTARSLRDIAAAGTDAQSINSGNISVITPSILVDEIEMVPTQQKPDRAPFVSLPK